MLFFPLLDTAIKVVKVGAAVISFVVAEVIKVSQEKLWKDVNVNTIGVVMSNVKNVPKHFT